MRVLVFTSLFPPTGGSFVRKRMFHFAALDGCSIKVVAPVPYFSSVHRNGGSNSNIGFCETLDGIEVYHPRYPLIPKLSMPFHWLSLFLSSMKLVKEIQRTFPFDLIDSHYIYPDGLAAVLMGKCTNVPVALSARGSDINQFPRFVTIRPMIRYALQRADHVISVCDALREEMTGLGIGREKISVIPNGVDTAQFYPVDRQRAREDLSLVDGKKIILSVGMLIERKGHHLLLDAMAELVRKDRDVHLYIIGEGAYRPVLECQMEDLGLEGFVTLIGKRSNNELNSWYNAADVFCLASSREGWPNVVMESLACGTPVVATNVWGLPEIIDSPELGVLVDRTSESIYRGLAEALHQNWDRTKIAAHGRSRTWYNVAEEVKATFIDILNRTNGLPK